MYSKENNILYCQKYCIKDCDRLLIDTIKDRLDDELASYQIGFTDYKRLTYFHAEKNRTFHFPALECAGIDPRIAILGITKGSTQVEDSLKLLSKEIISTKDLNINQLASLLNRTSIHSVFAGTQIRRNIGNLFEKIGLWENIGFPFQDEFPEKSVNEIIGGSNMEPHKYFYIASFIKCALLTKEGKSDAPSIKELGKIEGAKKCIENNLLPPFGYYKRMKVLITFGKTSYEIVNQFKIEDKTIIDHMTELNVTPIFLPHPSGANIANLQRYLSDDLELDWLTTPKEASKIIDRSLN